MKKITQSSTLHTSKRTYFINRGKLREEGIIEITESKRHGNGKFKRSKILIYEEDLEEVIEAIKKLDEEGEL